MCDIRPQTANVTKNKCNFNKESVLSRHLYVGAEIITGARGGRTKILTPAGRLYPSNSVLFSRMRATHGAVGSSLRNGKHFNNHGVMMKRADTSSPTWRPQWCKLANIQLCATIPYSFPHLQWSFPLSLWTTFLERADSWRWGTSKTLMSFPSAQK